MFHKFVSLQYADKYGYHFESNPDWSSNRNAEVSRHFLMFDTCGDRQIQHSPSWPITREYLGDYLASLAVDLLANKELADAVAYELRRTVDEKEVVFAASVVHKPADDEYSTRRYFSLQEKKISRSPAKEHDKRYQRIDENHDGSASSIFRIVGLGQEFMDNLQRLQYAMGIHDWMMKQDGLYMPYPCAFIKWFPESDPQAHEKGCETVRALELCRSICESYRLRDCAERELENIARRLARIKEQAAA